MLYDPNEKMPPSSPASIKHMARIAEKLSIDVEPITKRQLAELAEYDGLFIRETTSIDNHTYRFARRAWQEGMPVIDDPISMIRCTNKVFLMELLGQNQVATPPTVMLADAGDLPRAMDELGLPLVVKIPDGSFSRGVHKVGTPEEFRRIADELFEETDLLLAQKFLPTEFDWRVGVLAGEPLFVCQYRMARGHWQIVKHRPDGSAREGGFKTFDLDKAPPRADRHRGARGAADRRRLLRRRHQGDRPRLHRHGGQRQPQPRARHRGPGRQGRDLGPRCSSGSSSGSSSSLFAIIGYPVTPAARRRSATTRNRARIMSEWNSASGNGGVLWIPIHHFPSAGNRASLCAGSPASCGIDAGPGIVTCFGEGLSDPASRRPNNRENSRPVSSMIVKNAGTKSRDSNVETRRPPMTAIAIGERNSPPAPNASALGAMPATIAIVVIMIGRARLRPASMIAVVRSTPPCIASMAKSTSMIAFLVTMPISIRMPMTTGVVIGRLVMSSAEDRAADRQRQRKQDGHRLQQAAEQHRQHDIDHHQAVAHRPAESVEQLGLQLGVAAFADRDAGGRLFITGSA